MKFSDEELRQKLHNETAQMDWHSLQRFFAQGKVVLVADDLDLVEIAAAFAVDLVEILNPLIKKEKIAAPSTDQARLWYDDNTILWSVVVAPYVLVQQGSTE